MSPRGIRRHKEHVRCGHPEEHIQCGHPEEHIQCGHPEERIQCGHPDERIQCGHPEERRDEGSPTSILRISLIFWRLRGPSLSAPSLSPVPHPLPVRAIRALSDPTFQGGKPAWIDLGVGNGWQCFLSGMFGDTLDGSVSVAQYGGGQSGTIESFENKGPESLASVPTGRWILEISGNDGAALSANAACIPASALGSSTVSDPPPVTLVKNVNHNTLCGFQSLGGSFGLLAPGQALPFEGSAMVSNDGEITPTFTNNSTWTWTDGTDIGVGNESIAACATASPALSWGGAGSSTVTTNFSVASGAMCFLSFVQGEFDVNSFSDGVGLSQVNPTTWTITVSSGKRAGFYCVE